MRDYERIAGLEGYRALFNQKNESYARTLVARAAGMSGYKIENAPAFADLDAVIARCQAEGIELKLVLYPYHAHFLQLLQLAGLQDAFDAWKQALVKHAAAAGMRHGRAVPIWDFSHYNTWTTESVPAAGDKKTRLDWYWEAGHFKKELGDLVLTRVLDPAFTEDDLGLRLDTSNVGRVLQANRARALQYQEQQAADWVTLANSVQRAKSGTGLVGGPAAGLKP